MDREGFVDRLKKGLLNLPRAALVAGAVGATALFATASIYAYRTYDYVQHDNDFCLSCHLMVDPFERFARSAHREMGCKSCHQPTMLDRSKMALTQIIENPDSLETHAQVPNERCAECHVEGDPEEWTLVANSAGHRMHFESDEPDLEELQCIECHSTALHVFAAADQTCGQSGCHQDVSIRLGAMSDLTIHCTACHAFSTPVPDTSGTEVVEAALQPTRDECLSCHAMRNLVEIPEDDPHDGVCASCHNPHEQTTPAGAADTCGTTGCHSRPETITPFHRGLSPGVLERCVACHAAHDFRAPGTDCVDCHTDLDAPGTSRATMRPGRMGASRPAPHPGAAAAAGGLGGVSPYLHPVRSSPVATRRVVRTVQQAEAPQERPIRFRHAAHRGVQCLDCHSTDDTHGALRVITPRDCLTCHHSPNLAEGPAGCTACHTGGDFATGPITRRQELRFASGKTYTRRLPFDHGAHETETCTRCHTEPLTLGVGDLSCSGCHDEHHEPDGDCTACHETPVETAHNVRSHLSCDGSGCHGAAPVDAQNRTRSLCIACHVEQAEHRPGESCIECHPLPTPGTRGVGMDEGTWR